MKASWHNSGPRSMVHGPWSTNCGLYVRSDIPDLGLWTMDRFPTEEESMKRTLIAVLICLFAISLTLAHEMVRDKDTIQLGRGKVTIDYGTPKLKGRNLDDMIKPGTAWRMGMDSPTTLETSVALDLNGKKLAPGKYILAARPDEKK